MWFAWWCCISWWRWWLYVAAPHYQIAANAPDAKNISELRRFAFYTTGEVTDIVHKDDCNPVSSVEYTYAVKTMQPNVLRNVQEAMKMSDADLWREAAEKGIKSLQDLNV